MNEELILSGSKQIVFDSRIDRTSHPKGCWVWTHTKDNKGYGVFWNGQKTVKCHRISYRTHKGSIPVETPFICHHCDNPSCVNPDHLYAGTPSQNSQDACDRGLSNPGKWSRENPEVISTALKKHIAENPHWVKRGEEQGRAKLTEDAVRLIRAEYTTGKISHRKLAKKWNVSRTLIRMIVSNQIWTHVV